MIIFFSVLPLWIISILRKSLRYTLIASTLIIYFLLQRNTSCQNNWQKMRVKYHLSSDILQSTQWKGGASSNKSLRQVYDNLRDQPQTIKSIIILREWSLNHEGREREKEINSFKYTLSGEISVIDRSR